ncbi:putative axial regulator YABBY 2 [Dendrobium catenatum]|uniref:Axial regulator YABBY 2 n=1 Tax=Dendrobium catenatum TaxID=906689 RepID=A0A2I0XF83_9ASPA|nr:putative axial regulator YABBY 2 [Dendrobium catenatum]XP_028553776.1 putative axial regulator YABBY 2 [Dendrobium catenatum]PKU86563.1 Putative axial regulator YABBY 2 [Dendrobium catenatum]
MSAPAVPDHVCYVHCNFCNTILVVSVPGSNLSATVTVRCGHCGNLLSVNMGVPPQSMPFQDLQGAQLLRWNCESSSNCNRISLFNAVGSNQLDMPPIHPQEKRQRVPSAYNRFIKEEIRRLKATNPDISHREAFSAAAKNWAHFPNIHFGLNHDGNSQVKIDDAIPAHGVQNSQGYY